MEQLIANIVSKVGIDETLAKSAVGIVLRMFANEGPSETVSKLMDALPGASELVAAAPGAPTAEKDDGTSDGLGFDLENMVGGALDGRNPIMDTLAELQEQGLSPEQAMQVGQEVAGFARENAGADLVNEIASSIPGLSAVL